MQSNSMKRLVALLMIASVPAFIFLNIWQVFRYEKLQHSIAVMEEEQQDWLERNKRMIAGIRVLSSPGRIDMLAQQELNLKKPGPGDIIRINIRENSR